MSDAPPPLQRDRPALVVTIVGTALFWLVLTAWRPWELFAQAGFTADFYDAQARSFWRLRLAVPDEVAGIEGFVIDGRTYLYYGPFLALVRMPFALVDVVADQAVFAGRLTRLSMVAAFAAWCAAARRLVHEAAQWFGGGSLSSRRRAVFVALAAASPMLALTGWVSVYHETEAWAAVFAVTAAVATLRLLRRPSRRDALVGALAVAAAVLTRASIGIGVGAAVGAIAVVSLLARHRVRPVIAPRPAITLAVGSAAGLAAHIALNLAKFGSALGLPAERQTLSLVDPERAAWFAGNGGSFFSLRFLPTTVAHYLRPDTLALERLVPFVRFGAPAVDRGSYPVETITPAASITAAAPALFVAAVAGVVLLLRAAVRRSGGTAWPWLALTAGALVAAVPTFTIGFIANRYLVDLLPLLVVPAAVATVTLRLRTGGLRRIAVGGLSAALVWSASANAALGTWIAHLKSPGFTELRYRVDGWLFDGPPPGVIDAVAGAPVPRDGVVGVVGVDAPAGRCAGVYVAEQGRWVALERTDGVTGLRGTVRPTTADGAASTGIDLASGDNWTARLSTDASTWWVEIDHDGGTTRSASRPGPLPSDATIDVDVIADPLIGLVEATARSDGAEATAGAFTRVDGPLLPGAALDSVEAGPGPLCRLFADRR